MPKRRSSALVVGVVCFLKACTFAPDPVVPPLVAEPPSSFAQEGALGTYEPEAWWSTFSAPTLDRLIDSVLVANLDIMEAVARVDEARAMARVAYADLFPSITGSADVSYQDQPNNSGFGAQILAILSGATDSTGEAGGEPPSDGEVSRTQITTYSSALSVSYELDFWGRIRGDGRAAAFELRATESDLQIAVLGVLSETIRTYFEIVDLDGRIAVSVEASDVLRERVTLAESRYDRGLISSFELYQLRQQLWSTEAALPQLRRQLRDARGRMAILLGRYSQDTEELLVGMNESSLVDDPVPAGLPADLLEQRPDVRAAADRLAAAASRVGARRAELYPRLTLSGSIGTQSGRASGLFNVSQWVSNLAAGLTAPLFQGGRLRANLSAAEAQFAQRTAAYGRTLLTAVEEVETALTSYSEERQRYQFLIAQRDEAASSVDLQAQRYQSGVAGYADYLDAVTVLLNIESTLAGAGRDVAWALLDVHRTLGGGWIEEDAVSTSTVGTSEERES